MVQSHVCTKTAKIDAMEKSLAELNNVIYKDANGDSLVSMTKDSHAAIKDMGHDIRALLTFQTIVETKQEVKNQLIEKKTKRQQWFIGLLVGTIFSLITIIIALATKTG